MKLSDELRIGEVCEVSGKQIKAGIYGEKNTEFLNFNGDVIKNVSLGSFVLIRKSYTNIIGKVEGEFIKEKGNEGLYEGKGENINRIVSISVLGILKHDEFVHGLNSLPMVGNYVYIVNADVISKIFTNTKEDNLNLGTLIGYGDYPFVLNCQKLLCSHIGIFGNTGSGKSNTLAKIYKETIDKYSKFSNFAKNSKFIFIDFNGEYKNVFRDANYYSLSTRSKKDKYPINYEDITDSEFWSIILEATDKTQKPFIERVIREFKYIDTQPATFDYNKLSDLVFESKERFSDVRIYLRELFKIFDLEKQFYNFENLVSYNVKTKGFYILNGDSTNYINSKEELYKIIFGDVKNEKINIAIYNHFDRFAIALYYQFCRDINRSIIVKEHINPLMARSHNRIEQLDKIFKIYDQNFIDSHYTNNVDVISLIGLSVDLRKIVPLLICKKHYNAKKNERKNSVCNTLHLIIDEAHNILSTTSIRESEDWKNYRLESFEEIIKEGRKFGTFLTLASQRPSDISDTIISQLHNYFIHRLVNEEDLFKIYRTISFSDKATNEMIPILPAGGCVFSGLATNFPILAQITKLNKEFEPTSQTVNIAKVWKDTL